MVIKCFIDDIEYNIANTYDIQQQTGSVSSSSIDILVENHF